MKVNLNYFLSKKGLKLVKNRMIATCGEITDLATWKWLNEYVGKGRIEILGWFSTNQNSLKMDQWKCLKPLIDSWWQTETGCPMINPRPSRENAVIPEGKSGRPFYGVDPGLMDGNGNLINSPGQSGHLVIRQPWPGMARTIHNNHARYKARGSTELLDGRGNQSGEPWFRRRISSNTLVITHLVMAQLLTKMGFIKLLVAAMTSSMLLVIV